MKTMEKKHHTVGTVPKFIRKIRGSCVKIKISPF
jgi:hypothetical protein